MRDPSTWTSAVVQRRNPMQPLATNVSPRAAPIPGIECVVFDIYGTLIISGSGEVGSATSPPTPPSGDVGRAIDGNSDPVAIALKSVNWNREFDLRDADLKKQILAANQAARDAEKCPSPEVEILDVWRDLMASASPVASPASAVSRRETGYQASGDGSPAGAGDPAKGEKSGHLDPVSDVARIVAAAADYESRTNPTWPMPDAKELLDELQRRGKRLGIVSNAQVFTIDLLESLCGASLLEGPFDLDLCVFSNRFRQSKPGPRLFDFLRRMLVRKGLRSEQVVYVGNDMLNDVWAASQAGLKTIWYAGDRRSLRAREDDSRCEGLVPDAVVTNLHQVLDCLV
ncbi:MAG: HAD family hydrolase [Planctomycetota bacterium]